ncbi:plant virulence effector HPE1-like domain-containing protein [Allorhizobium terrae]|uniref:plant virulence effector HPE1-like domain-containing protein n=1 Tax=Allorhizobium terrae TaxID=1848972 RepID=UPI0011ACB9C7|nr:plant virulence effector HPE1-like domain-containing protein [Allorhizobium terrae]TWD55277.1 hypothetical protein FB480_10286 [Agrobacterium vitis]
MRLVIIAALVTVGSSLGFSVQAQASSIQSVSIGTGPTPSVLDVSCATCPPLPATKDSSGPKLKPGTQTIKIRTVDGQKELVRTEAWLGGSPVVFVNKQAGWLDNGSRLAGMPSDGIDKSTETGAVHSKTFADDTIPLRLK